MPRRISLLRLGAVVAGTAVMCAGLGSAAASTWDRLTVPTDGPARFVPYVDATLMPSFAFEDPVTSPSSEVVLGFVVAAAADRCEPSWGTYYDLDGAGSALDLDRRIVRLRERGGDATVSFGGAFNAELATVCSSVPELADAYRAVIDRYGLTKIDADIEGAALADPDANRRRGEALALLQHEARAAGRSLEVWLTLPLSPTGLTPDGLAVVAQTVEAGVELGGVNGMAMNFGTGGDVRTNTETGITALAAQLDGVLRANGEALLPADLWRRVGVTPMIGQNDVAGEVFSLADADWLVARARTWGLGRVSMWSANRDAACGAAVDGGRVSNTCSGVAQQPLDFTWRFARLDAGGVATDATVARAPGTERGEGPRDDPSTSPYPIWRATKQYAQGDKVVWQHDVYEAKWWNENARPNAAVDNPWDTPWRYVGPVLPTDAPAATNATVDTGPDPWSADKVYLAGQEVTWQGELYRAKWWTQDDEPELDPDRPTDVPWVHLGPAPEEE